MRGAAGRIRSRNIRATALLAACASATLAPAPARGDVAADALRHLRSDPRLADDPGGVRSQLERLGLTFQLFYNAFLAAKPSGGADPGSTFGHSGSYDFFTLVDGEALVGWPGLDVLLHVKGQYDDNINRDVGALSDPIDDADFDEPVYVDELWLQQAVLGDRVRLRAGFLESQTVFDRNAYANSEDRQFLSTFLDNDPVVPLPNGLGAALIVSPWPWLEIAAGAADADNVPRRAGFDTAFDDVAGLTGYLELTLRAEVAGPRGPLPGALRAGAFVDGRERTVFGRTDPASGLPLRERGHWGAYMNFEQLAWREPGEDEGRSAVVQGLALFGRFGAADPDVNPVAWFWSLGAQYAGPLPGRDRDVLGAAAYQAIGSSRYRETVDPRFGRETGIEVYYQAWALPWLAVTPDFQYIVDPGARGTAEDALVLVLRFRVGF